MRRASFLWPPVVVLVLGLVATAAVSLVLARMAEERDQERFDHEARHTRELLQDRLRLSIALLRATAGLFSASEQVTREEFQAFAAGQRLGEEFTGMRGLGYSVVVDPADVPALEQEMRGKGEPQFRVWPDHPRDEVHSIVYLQPRDARNDVAIGYDMSTDPARREAMHRSRDAAAPVASRTVKLVQEIVPPEQHGFLIYHPVYSGPGIPADIPARRARLRGFAYAPFRLDDLLAAALPAGPGRLVDFEVYDGPAAHPDALRYPDAPAAPHPRFVRELPMEFAGRTWTLRFHPRPEFLAGTERHLVLATAIGGVLFSLLLFAAGRSERRARSSAETSARRLAAEARALETVHQVSTHLTAERDLSALVQAVTDAANELAGARFSALFYNQYGEHGESYALYTLSGVSQEEFGRFPMPRNTAVFGPTFRGEGVVLSADITKDPRYGHNPPYHGMPAGHLPVRSYLAVPVVSRSGEVLGGLFLGHPDPGAFTSRESRLVQALVAHAAVAIDNARLYQSLASSEERYRSLAQATSSVVWTTNPGGEIVAPQPAWEHFTGQSLEQYRGFGWIEALHPDDRPRVIEQWRNAVRDRSPYEEEVRLWHAPSGTYHAVVDRGVPLLGPDGELRGWVGAVADVHEQKRLEEQLQQAHKLESIGRLAGGIAHDFNNLLTAILGDAALAEADAAAIPAPGIVQHLQEITAAAERAGSLTGQLLAFARRQVVEPRVIEVNARIQAFAGILRRVLGESIELVTVLAPDAGSTRIDPGQLEQVLLNLAANARDAMPDGGRLTIETAAADLGPDYARAYPGVVPGAYVMLAVTDTGVGMDEAIQQHVFEPFFTTKEIGRGTGLGLATCYGIVHQAGGHIWLYSEPGKGTCFRIYLRRVAAAPTTPPPPEREPAPPRQRRTVLVVEDEEGVRKVACLTLATYGYQVLSAPSGEEALAVAADSALEIHLLLTDVVLPGISGKELADQMARLRPNLPVLFTSGYTDKTIMRHGVLDPHVRFLQKPYTPRQLARRVEEVLAESAPADLADPSKKNTPPAAAAGMQ